MPLITVTPPNQTPLLKDYYHIECEIVKYFGAYSFKYESVGQMTVEKVHKELARYKKIDPRMVCVVRKADWKATNVESNK